VEGANHGVEKLGHKWGNWKSFGFPKVVHPRLGKKIFLWDRTGPR